MPLYVAHFVVEIEDQWIDLTVEAGRRTHFKYFVHAQLFVAENAEAAYAKAILWVDGFGDAIHDGPGDVTTYRGIGLHDLEEILHLESSSKELEEIYGIDVGVVAFGETKPEVRQREALDVFRNAD
ncbi:MAG: hypothetical protein JWN73_2485 [Betaproteobacteria bacterium]|nr:hypothetical protein [Betaproteobacteria bacterium]